MLPAKDDQIKATTTALHDTWKVVYIAPVHCTGEPAFAVLKESFGDTIVYAGLGTTVLMGRQVTTKAEAGQAKRGLRCRRRAQLPHGIGTRPLSCASRRRDPVNTQLIPAADFVGHRCSVIGLSGLQNARFGPYSWLWPAASLVLCGRFQGNRIGEGASSVVALVSNGSNGLACALPRPSNRVRTSFNRFRRRN